jgi:hypothetical protein
MLLRTLVDHKPSAITCLVAESTVTPAPPAPAAKSAGKDKAAAALAAAAKTKTTPPALWAAASADRRISVWRAAPGLPRASAHTLAADWLSLPAPPFVPRPGLPEPPPTLVHWVPRAPGLLVVACYGTEPCLRVYDVKVRAFIRTWSLLPTPSSSSSLSSRRDGNYNWAVSLSISGNGRLAAVGTVDRLVALIDLATGARQDFVFAAAAPPCVYFAAGGRVLLASAQEMLLCWRVNYDDADADEDAGQASKPPELEFCSDLASALDVSADPRAASQ